MNIEDVFLIILLFQLDLKAGFVGELRTAWCYYKTLIQVIHVIIMMLENIPECLYTMMLTMIKLKSLL